jgi:hypothetical protein
MTDLPADPQPDTRMDDETDLPASGSSDKGDDGAALDRAAESIRDAQAAEGTVAANEDITSLDEQRAGEHSETPDGGGELP